MMKRLLMVGIVLIVYYNIFVGEMLIEGTSLVFTSIIIWILGSILIGIIFPKPRKKKSKKRRAKVRSDVDTPLQQPSYVPISSTGSIERNETKDVKMGGKTCPTCGNTDPDSSAKFCMFCGTKLS